jgi:hypothetical protein
MADCVQAWGASKNDRNVTIKLFSHGNAKAQRMQSAKGYGDLVEYLCVFPSKGASRAARFDFIQTPIGRKRKDVASSADLQLFFSGMR